MAISKDKKKKIVENVTNAISDSESMVFVNFHGLGVSDTNELRRSLREEEVGYTVAKKTLIRRALDAANIPGDQPELAGELAIAYGKDLLAPARGVYEFSKKHKENIAILGGIFEGEYKTQDEMIVIASIPPMQTLRAMFVNIINSPIQGFASVLHQVAEKREA
ncbi:50S ribosomal protein L10 [Candidatus Wolfebacteria bacterium]|nr:MAG: 50S ribosomal protein L10 [Candidatus Wolfebacteria bacterium]